nr:MAG TPA: MAEBL protein [Caudoviricetes sp.]
MVVKYTPRHEQIDARVWDAFMSRWWPLAPWQELSLQGRADWSVDTGSLTLSADHPQLPRLRQCRHVPVPVTFTINGVHWDGYVESVETGQNEDGTQYAQVNLWSEHKHFHRMLARSTVASAADSSSETLTSHIGELTHRLVSRGVVRTGLPTYVLVEADGDPVEVEVRTEDYVADILDEPLAGSDSFVEVRKLLPGQEVPGVGTVRFYTGVMERQWMRHELSKGRWPNAKTNPRIFGDSLAIESPAMPENSWNGDGRIRFGELTAEDTAGICWIPFETVVDRPLGYYETVDSADVFVVSRGEIQDLAGAQAHRPHFVTEWKSGTFTEGRVGKLKECAEADLLRKTNGKKLSYKAALSYIGSGAAYAWKEGVEWVLANSADFKEDNKRYEADGKNQKQTPGTFVWQHQGRDRRGVVFSSAPGGGLRKWSTTETGPDGAMLIGGGQMDAQTIAALESGVLQPKGTVGTVDADSAAAYLPGSAGFPSEVEKLDIDVQPHATIDGTEVSFSKAGGRVDIAQAGPFFLREKYMNLSSTGGTNPTAEIAREWARSQGTTSMSLAPGHHETVVFGDDIRLPDGRVVPGWKPGDRVSFVDKTTRVSEVIMGYSLKSSANDALSVEPILGREVNGVLASLERKIKAQEKAGRKALLAPSRKLPKTAVERVADERFNDGSVQWRKDIEGDLSAASRYSEEAHRYSQESLKHTKQSAAYSEESQKWSVESQGHSKESLGYSEASKRFSEAAAQHSEDSHKHALESAKSSQSSLEYSNKASEFTDSAREFSNSADELSKAAKGYSDAASLSAEDAEKYRGLAEEARRKAENARADAEDARGEAERARAGAESERSKAELARDAAETSRASAESERSKAESARAQAERARSAAEAWRNKAEQERSKAETARGTAEQARDNAEQERKKAEQARSDAVQAFKDAQRIRDTEQDISLQVARHTAEFANGMRTVTVSTRGKNVIENDYITGFIDKESWGLGGVHDSNFHVSAKGKWAGNLSILMVNDEGYIDGHSYGVGPKTRGTWWQTKAPVDIDHVQISIQPYYPDDRRFLIPALPMDAGKKQGMFDRPVLDYSNIIEGEPIEFRTGSQLKGGIIRFPYFDVKCAQKVWVPGATEGQWKTVSAGSTIPAKTIIMPYLAEDSGMFEFYVPSLSSYTYG